MCIIVITIVVYFYKYIHNQCEKIFYKQKYKTGIDNIDIESNEDVKEPDKMYRNEPNTETNYIKEYKDIILPGNILNNIQKQPLLSYENNDSSIYISIDQEDIYDDTEDWMRLA